MRVAVVGCGRQGTIHLEAYEAIPDVELVAVCDSDATRAADAATRFRATAYTEYSRLFETERVDLVSVVTMPVTHRDIVVAALGVGLHVLCEKPMAMNLDEAREMARAAQSNDRTLTLGYNMRHMGSASFLRELVKHGELGRPRYTRAWLLDNASPSWGRHHVRALAGGGVLMADAGHVLDLALFVAGYPRATSVSASATRLFPGKRASALPSAEAAAYDVEDLAAAHIRFADDSFMTLEVAWGWDAPEPSYSFEMIGDRAGIIFDPLRVVREVDGAPVDLTPSNIADTDWDASVRRELAAVVHSLQAGTAPIVRLDHALAVQAIVDACYRSVAAGHEVGIEGTEL